VNCEGLSNDVYKRLFVLFQHFIVVPNPPSFCQNIHAVRP